MPRQKLRASKKIWDVLPWKKISCEDENLGDFNDAMFFGLEEVDGSEYEKYLGGGKRKVVDVEPESEHNEEELEPVLKKVVKKEKKTNKKKDSKPSKIAAEERATTTESTQKVIVNSDASWNNSLELHSMLVNALTKLNFVSPTPIQSNSIPLTLRGNCDVVGSAETGSGKTLAFGLPILHSLLHEWDQCCNMHTPYALILAPTRELAKQITSVLSDLCRVFQGERRVQVVNVIGGMSEHKQRRQLSGGGKPVHIVVATPGRLCDLISDSSVVPFRNMSRIRYLVIDEADRMVEEGHFPELFRLFNRIREHEKIAASGKDPVEVERLAAKGTDYNSEEEESDRRKSTKKMLTGGGNDDTGVEEIIPEEPEYDLEDDLPAEFDVMPTEEQLEAARREQSALSLWEQQGMIDNSEEDDEAAGGPSEVTAADVLDYKANCRRTLLFSATALGVGAVAQEERGGGKKRRQQQKLENSLGGEKKAAALKALGIPDHLRQLLEAVGVQDCTVVTHGDKGKDCTGSEVSSAAKSAEQKGKRKRGEDISDKEAAFEEGSGLQAIPRSLSQFEICMPVEDKDVVAYYFLLKNPGRTLIFVNSIKTARRLDGLLRALEVNCRTIHSQLQQKQRIKALESFTSSPICCLVATDVAARGLDLPKIQYVLHYDVARSPQVYVHRSGRTARAGLKGSALSLVAPEDTDHHTQICQSLGVASLPTMPLDLSAAPVVKERVQLAKKIFTESFVSSQKSKEKNWLETSARDADLLVDEALYDELESSLNSKGQRQRRDEKMSKKSIDRERMKLRALLHEPVEIASSSVGQARGGGISRGGKKARPNKRAFVVVAK